MPYIELNVIFEFDLCLCTEKITWGADRNKSEKQSEAMSLLEMPLQDLTKQLRGPKYRVQSYYPAITQMIITQREETDGRNSGTDSQAC